MAFPLTHLIVAREVLKLLPHYNPEDFLLGSIAPDAVHYREEFVNASHLNIGPTKKITHLCPVSDEKWGQVTDNDSWVICVQDFLRKHPNDSFMAGYAVHALTDLYNNKTLWHNFRTKFPEVAAQGYGSGYYVDLRRIDNALYFETLQGDIFTLLANATPKDLPNIILAKEVAEIQNNLLHVAYANIVPENNISECTYLTYEEVQTFIKDAALFCKNALRMSYKEC